MEELFENPQAIILLVFMVIAALKFIGENLKGKKEEEEEETQSLANLYDDSREEILERQQSASPPPPLQKQAPEQLSILDFFGPPVGSRPEEETPSSPPPLPDTTATPVLPTPKPKPSLSAAEKEALKRVEEGQAGITRSRRSNRRRPIRELLATPAAARDAIVLREILGPPKGQQ